MTDLPRDWLPTLTELLQREPVVVRIVVAEVRGSAPRDAGAFMLVSAGLVLGTIGGGRLEWEALAAARELLIDASTAARYHKVVLGADLGQCCGGVVGVWLDRFTRDDLSLLMAASAAGARGHAVLCSTLKGTHLERGIRTLTGFDGSPARLPCLTRVESSGELSLLERLDSEFPAVWLYGAGHVGRALARILIELPLCLTWIDSRAELRTEAGVRYEPDPVASLSEAPVGAYFLVMTHSHPLDFRLCHEILQRNDFAWLGLIGSASKSARFRSRLRREGIDAQAVARLVCPVGIEGIHSKWPAAIAVAVAAEVMREISSSDRTIPARVGLPPLREPSQRSERSLHVDPSAHACSQDNCATCGRDRTTVTS